MTKQEIKTGESSEEYIVVLEGIVVDNEISMIAPDGAAEMEVNKLQIQD